MALDRFGRRIHYLRISLTDHCNLRCVYCMPEDMTFRPNAEMMQDDELLALVRLFASLGFDKYRLTGGEPTVRAHIVDLVREIAHTPGVEKITMTTNGVLLSRLARPLAEAGLQRVNVSLDTLDPQKFNRLTRWGKLEDVWAGIEAAEAAGLRPVKLNAVVVRGYNEADVANLARLTLDHPWQVRFIEMMPLGSVSDFQTEKLVTVDEMRARIESVYGSLEPVHWDGHNPSRPFRIQGGQGTIGFISSVSAPFCEGCDRMRLTSDGRLHLCLLRDDEVDLLTPLRSGASDEDLRTMMSRGVFNKPWGHGLADQVHPELRIMSQVGG